VSGSLVARTAASRRREREAEDPGAPLLETTGLTKRFGGVTAVDSLDLTVGRREALGVIGPNGAGKSTLIGLLNGAHRPTSGTIRIAGRDVTGAPPHAIARLGIGRTHQVPQPFAQMTVLENLMLGRLYAGEPASFSDADRDCRAILERTGLGAQAETPAGRLPLLSLKRLELARALALGPRLLLLDEIGAGLIEAELAELIALVQELKRDVESILIVEHVLDVIQECCDRVVVLDWGKKLVEGSPSQVLADPQVAAVYLGTGSASAERRRLAGARAGEGALLSVEGIGASYDTFRALRDVTFAVEPGEVVALLGANGAGKTTTARVLSGMLRADAGSVTFKGTRIDGRSPHEIVRLGLVHCMEGRRIFADLTVEENLLLGGRNAASKAERATRLGRVYELFDVLAMKRNDSGATLSGGQQQMLAIGRALMADPELVIFDEISLGLAPVVVDQLYGALAELNERGVTMVIIEQNVERGLALANHVHVLERGAVALSGTPDELRGDPRVRALYVGEARGEA